MISKIIKLSVFVNSSAILLIYLRLLMVPKYNNGFFGKKVGSHSRTAVGVNSLPRNAICEIDFYFSKN